METDLISVPQEKFEKMEADLSELREKVNGVDSDS